MPAGLPVDVRLEPPGFAPVHLWQLVLQPEERRDAGAHRLAAGASIAGWVENPEGEPLAGAVISMAPLQPEHPDGGRAVAAEYRAKSDASGFFQISQIVPGAYRLVSRAEKLAPAVVPAITIRPLAALTWPRALRHSPAVTFHLTIEPAKTAGGVAWNAMLHEADAGNGNATSKWQSTSVRRGRRARAGRSKRSSVRCEQGGLQSAPWARRAEARPTFAELWHSIRRSMPISLVQRASRRGTLHVWIAVTNVTAAPALAWTLDGAPANPRALAPLASARTPAQVSNANEARAFVGLFEFDDPAPGNRHVVAVSAPSASGSLPVRSLPAEVPQASMSGRPLRILLASCFHSVSDPRGVSVGRHAAELIRREPPDLTFLLGDQVYLDLPLTRQPAGDEVHIARDLEQKYLANWVAPSGRGYYEILAAAPTVFNADDHEYWNNYPHAQPQLKNTWWPGRRRAWTSAAIRMWSAFQLQHGVQAGQPFVLDDVAPLSILFVDTRTLRKDEVLFDARGAATINRWADALAASPDRVGMLVSGQSIFDRKSVMGTLFDKNLLDFPQQYAVLVNAVKRAAARRPVLCITGDVHYGRVLAVRDFKTSGRLFEVISSPAALVDSPVKNATTALNPFDDPVWPKHGNAPRDDELHFPAFPGVNYANAHAQRGNHITMLSLTRNGASLNVEARFKPMHPTRELPDSVVQFTLR